MSRKWSNFILNLGTAGPPTFQGIRDLGFALVSDFPTQLSKFLRVDQAQTFTSPEKTQGRANLGVVIGTDVQAYDAGLTSIAGLTTGADRMIYTTGADVWAVTPLTAFARSVLDDADATAFKTTLSLQNVDNTSDANKPVSTAQQAALNLKANVGSSSPGAIFGLTLSNDPGDLVNDIAIALGSAASDATVPTSLSLASAITKRLDAAWAVGSGNGGLDTGSIANAVYYMWLIQRSDTGVVDVLFSLSATAPTLPTNYDRKRRIGFVIRSAGAIILFKQYGDRFIYATPITDFNSTIGTTASPLPLTVPPIQGQAIVNARAAIASTNATVYLSGPDQVDAAPSSTGPFSLVTDNIAGGSNSTGQFPIDTNTGAIRGRSSSASTTLVISTMGFIDPRGK